MSQAAMKTAFFKIPIKGPRLFMCSYCKKSNKRNKWKHFFLPYRLALLHGLWQIKACTLISGDKTYGSHVWYLCSLKPSKLIAHARCTKFSRLAVISNVWRKGKKKTRTQTTPYPQAFPLNPASWQFCFPVPFSLLFLHCYALLALLFSLFVLLILKILSGQMGKL